MRPFEENLLADIFETVANGDNGVLLKVPCFSKDVVIGSLV